MSLGYADKLSYREDLGGSLGDPELYDDARTVQQGVSRIAQLVRTAPGPRAGPARRVLGDPAPADAHRAPCRSAMPSAWWPSRAPASPRRAASQVGAPSRAQDPPPPQAVWGGSHPRPGRAAPPAPLPAPAPTPSRQHAHPTALPLPPADFRGPNGIWTLQRAGKELPKLGVSFLYAKPSLTHMVGAACWGEPTTRAPGAAGLTISQPPPPHTHTTRTDARATPPRRRWRGSCGRAN